MLGFDKATAYLPKEMRDVMKRVPNEVRRRTQEIRLRAGAPVTLSTPEREYWVTRTGELSTVLTDHLLTVDQQTVESCFEAMCDYSVHNHQTELRRGFITTREGLRVGLSGTVVVKDEKVTSMRQLTGLCVRISRSHDGCARPLAGTVCRDGRIVSTLICSEPSGGKTSLLRDLAHQLSVGVAGRRFRVTVLDERGELSAGKRLDHCDVLLACPKEYGIEQALRCLAPDVIIFDEVGTPEEAVALCVGSHTGTAVITTAHARDAVDLMGRKTMMTMVQDGVFEQIVFLKGRHAPGEIDCVMTRAQLLAETVAR